MPLEWTERPIDTIAFDEDSVKKIDIPRDNPIRRIICEFFIKIVNPTGTTTASDDDILEIATSCKLIMNGKDVKFSKSTRQWYYMEKDDKGTSPYKDALILTASITTTHRFVLVHDFASDPLDRQDITALLPANRLSSLKLEITWGALSTILSSTDDATTITDADSGVDVEIREVSGTVEKDGSLIDIADLPFAEIREDSDATGIPPSKTSFDSSTFKKDITPAPANILKVLLLVLDNDVRTNSFITEIKIQREKGGNKRLYHRTWDSLWRENKAEQGLESAVTGVLALDFVDIFGRGLINRGNEGDIRWRFLTGSTTESADNLEILTRYITLGGQ